MSELTPQEVAEYIEAELSDAGDMLDSKAVAVYSAAASIVRQYANGELMEVVHAHWTAKHTCSKCGKEPYRASNRDFPKHCPFCGALMDGKDDSHETD